MSPIRRAIHKVADTHPGIVVILLFVYLTALGVSVLYLGYQTRQVTEENHRTLCAFRGDLDRRLQGAEAFLKAHPHGVDGISRSTILLSIHNQQSAVAALHYLNC